MSPKRLSTPGLPGLPLIQNGGGGRGADARAARLINLQYLVEGPDAAGRFDADFLGQVPAHQGDVRQGVPGRGKTGGGLDEIDFGALTREAGGDASMVR